MMEHTPFVQLAEVSAWVMVFVYRVLHFGSPGSVVPVVSKYRYLRGAAFSTGHHVCRCDVACRVRFRPGQ
eukprot:s6652_g3.t1